jgi:predicted RNase H-like HicB family nuclease
MKLKVVIHKAEEGGFWAEVPSIPGCVSQGETMEEVVRNVHEAIEGCLSIDLKESQLEKESQIIEIAV